VRELSLLEFSHTVIDILLKEDRKMLKFVGDLLVPLTPARNENANPMLGHERSALRALLPPEYHEQAFLDPPDWDGNLRQEADRCFANVRLIERRIADLSNNSFKNGEFVELEQSADAEIALHGEFLRLHRKKHGQRSLRKAAGAIPKRT